MPALPDALEVMSWILTGAGAEGVQDVQASVCGAASGGGGVGGHASAARRPVQATSHPADPPRQCTPPAQEAQAQRAQQAGFWAPLAGHHAGAHTLVTVLFLNNHPEKAGCKQTGQTRLRRFCHACNAGKSMSPVQ